MFRYDTISHDSGVYKLSALIDEHGYDFISLVKEIANEEVFGWDNDNYLYNELIPRLQLKIAAADITEFIPVEDFKDVLELLLEGDKIGFFNKTKLKTKQNEQLF